jgi:hypothetical protein
MTRPYDFDLFITQSNVAYTVQARATRGGELPAQPLILPFNPARLPDKRRDVAEWIRYARETRLRGPEELREARAFGKTAHEQQWNKNSIFSISRGGCDGKFCKSEIALDNRSIIKPKPLPPLPDSLSNH